MKNKTTFELPCDFGDSIYEACKICSKVHERKVTGFKIGIGGNLILTDYNEPIKQDKELKKISDLDIMKIRTKK